MQRRALLSEAKTLQTLRRERENDPGAAFTIEVAILRTNAELECVEAAEARADQHLIDMSRPAEQAADGADRVLANADDAGLGVAAQRRHGRVRRA